VPLVPLAQHRHGTSVGTGPGSDVAANARRLKPYARAERTIVFGYPTGNLRPGYSGCDAVSPGLRLMTTRMVDPRIVKAIALEADAGQWLKIHVPADGRKLYGIPSQGRSGAYHLVDYNVCSCPDFQQRRAMCKHVLAVRLHCVLNWLEKQRQETRRPRVGAARHAGQGGEAEAYARAFSN
jgi:hypothetical protein